MRIKKIKKIVELIENEWNRERKIVISPELDKETTEALDVYNNWIVGEEREKEKIFLGKLKQKLIKLDEKIAKGEVFEKEEEEVSPSYLESDEDENFNEYEAEVEENNHHALKSLEDFYKEEISKLEYSQLGATEKLKKEQEEEVKILKKKISLLGQDNRNLSGELRDYREKEKEKEKEKESNLHVIINELNAEKKALESLIESYKSDIHSLGETKNKEIGLLKRKLEIKDRELESQKSLSAEKEKQQEVEIKELEKKGAKQLILTSENDRGEISRTPITIEDYLYLLDNYETLKNNKQNNRDRSGSGSSFDFSPRSPKIDRQNSNLGKYFSPYGSSSSSGDDYFNTRHKKSKKTPLIDDVLVSEPEKITSRRTSIKDFFCEKCEDLGRRDEENNRLLFAGGIKIVNLEREIEILNNKLNENEINQKTIEDLKKMINSKENISKEREKKFTETIKRQDEIIKNWDEYEKNLKAEREREREEISSSRDKDKIIAEKDAKIEELHLELVLWKNNTIVAQSRSASPLYDSYLSSEESLENEKEIGENTEKENISSPKKKQKETDNFHIVNFLTENLGDNSELDRKIKDAEKNFKNLERENRELKLKLSNLSEETEDLREQLEEAKKIKPAKSDFGKEQQRKFNFTRGTVSSLSRISKGNIQNQTIKNNNKSLTKIKDDKVKLQATISEQEKKIKELENFIIEEKNNRDELDKCHKELETRLEAEIKKLKTEKEKLSFSLSVAESELLKSEKLELITSSPTEKSETREIITTTLIQGLQRKINRLELELEDKERKLRDLKEKYNDEIVEKAKQDIKETEEFETFSELYDQQEELKNKIVELERELAKSKVKGKENCDIEKHKYLENQIIILLTTIKTTEKSLEKVKMTLDLTGKEREKLLEIIKAQKEQVKSGQLTSTEQEFLKLIPDPLYSAREGEPIEKCFGWENFETQLERLQTWMNEKQISDFPNLDAFSILISLTRVKEFREHIEEVKNKSELEKPTELEAEKRCEAKEYEEHKNLVEKLIFKEEQISLLREESDHYYAKIVGEEDLKNEIRKLKGELLAVQGKGKKQEIGSSCRDCKEYWEKWNEVRETLGKSEIIQKEQASKIENLNELLNHNGVEFAKKLTGQEIKNRKENEKIVQQIKDNYSDILSQEKREREIEKGELTSKIEGLTEEKDEIITNLKTSLTNEQSKRTTAENDLTDCQAATTERINDLKNELNETTRAYENSINQNSNLRFNLNEARDLNTNLQQQLSQMEQAADSYWEHVKSENKNYQDEIKRLQGLVDTLPGEFLDTQDEWLKRDYPDEFAELERNGKALNVKNLIELLQKKLADYEKLKSNWDQEKKEVEDIYQIEKENWENEFKTLKDDLSTEQAKRKKYTRYYTNTNLKLVQKQLQAEKQQALITNLKQDLNRLAREYQQAKKHSDSTNYDQVWELKNQIKEKQETIEHLESKMTALNQLAETELTEHEQNNTNLQNQLNDQKSTLDEQTKTIALQDEIEAKLRQTNDDLNTDYQALKTEQVAAQQKINDLTAENRDLDTYLAGLDDVLLNKNSELTKFLREKGQLEKQIEKLKVRLTNTKNDWEAEVDGLEKQNKKLQKKLATAIELFGQEKVKNKKLKNFKGDANKLFERAKWLNYLLETRTEQRDRARQKLKDLKAQQEELKRTAETKQVSLALIKYQGESISDEQIDQQFLTSVITDTSNALVDEIAKTQNYLGVKDLTQIATAPEYKLPKDKTLTDLIQAYYDNDIQQVIQAFPELNHLGSDSSVGEVINTLKTLLNKPPIIITKTEKDNSFQVELEQAQKVITRLEKELGTKPVKEIINTPFGEELTVIIQLELTSLQELFGNQLDPLTQKQIREATTYSQVVQARQNFLAKHLNFTAGSTLNSAPIQSTWPVERVFWLIWLLISLGVIGGLLVKMKNKRKKN